MNNTNNYIDKPHTHTRGFVAVILVLLLTLILLSFVGFDLRVASEKVLANEHVQNNFVYLWELIQEWWTFNTQDRIRGFVDQFFGGFFEDIGLYAEHLNPFK